MTLLRSQISLPQTFVNQHNTLYGSSRRLQAYLTCDKYSHVSSPLTQISPTTCHHLTVLQALFLWLMSARTHKLFQQSDFSTYRDLSIVQQEVFINTT